MRSKLNAALVCLMLMLASRTAFAQPVANIVLSGSNLLYRCSDTVTTLTCQVSGGTGPYTYLWSPVTGLSDTNSQVVTAAISASTTYTVTVTDANSSTASSAVYITVVNCTLPIASAGNDTTICQGGSALLGGSPTAIGGIPPYTYAWSNGVPAVANPAITPTLTTTYYVTVTDAVHNIGVAAVTVYVNNCTGALTVNAGNNDTICANSTQQLVAVIHGGTPPYSYTWAGIGLEETNAEAVLAVPAVTTVYTVTVTDNNSNTATTAFTVVVNALPKIDSLNVTNATCYGASDGSICAVISGNGPFTYIWSNGVNQSCNSNLGATLYQLTLEDKNNCSASATASVSQPAQLSVSLMPTNVSCFGSDNGTICANATGVGPFYYAWSNGATPQCISQLPAGNYSITVTNASGCTATANTTVSQPAQLTLSLIANNVSCNGGSNGSVILTPNGGTPAYTYVWSNGTFTVNPGNLGMGTYMVTVTDAHGCTATDTVQITQPPLLVIDSIITHNATCGGNNGSLTAVVSGGAQGYLYVWSNTATTQTITNLAGGTYTITVNDANACTATAFATVSQSAGVVINSVQVTNVSCYGGTNGSVCVYATGNLGPYPFLWSTGDTQQCPHLLSAGIYEITVTDVNGCSASASAIVTQPANALTDSIAITNIGCNGGSTGMLEAFVTGGTGAYHFQWSNSAQTPTINNLPVGTYSVTIIDANACSISDTASIVQATPVIIDSFHITNVTCHDSANGAVCVYATGAGGASPFTWSTGEASQCIQALNPGNYSITVEGSTGCTASATTTITQPAPLTDSISTINCNLCDYASGGTPPYVYLWSNGATGQCINNLSPAMYITWVTDANNCIVKDTATLTLHIQYQVFTPDTNAVPDSVTLSISGGLAPYSVSWGDGNYNNEIDSTSLHVYGTTGFYYLYVIDSLGCSSLEFRVDAGCSDQCVWPGDANYDGVVDNNDLLPIGLGYDSTGYARLNPTINFIPQFCFAWADTLLGGVNYKHVDCNGDGIINANDTTAIMLNYGLTHPRGGGKQPWRTDAPGLYVSVSPDTLVDGQIATATLSLGDSAMPCSNVYALAFTYNFDPLVVDTSSVSITFGNSWLASTGDHINIGKNFTGQVQAALTRIDHTNRSGEGAIATVSMKITTGNINGKNLLYYLFGSFISNLTVIDKQGNIIPVNEGTDSVEVQFVSTVDITPVINTDIRIFPNPATDQLNITSGHTGIEDIRIVDLTGQLVLQQNTGASLNTVVDISTLSVGVYTISIKEGGQEYHSRFVKINVK